MNSDQQLDRLEDEIETVKQLLTSAASVTESNSKAISRLTERVNQVTVSVDRSAERFDRFVEQAESDRDAIREMQAEVRGILTKNHRILEFLFGQRGE